VEVIVAMCQMAMPVISKSTSSVTVLLLVGVLLSFSRAGSSQTAGRSQTPPGQSVGALQEESQPTLSSQAEDELQKGTAFTRHGDFDQAIPHLLAARGRVSNEYAASFNLALCYVATGQNKSAIEILKDLPNQGRDGAGVENLLAQAYIGNGKSQEAFTALKKAAAITPQDEKLYLLVADACEEHQDFALGLKVVEIGLDHLPQSPRLHYQRAMMLWQLGEFDRAKADFASASKLGQGSDIGSISSAQEALLNGDIPGALKIARDGVSKGFDNPILLTILGEALLRSGVSPGEPAFAEAQTALERAVAARPNDATAQITLGQIDLAAEHLDDAIAHLEKARQMQPSEPSVYASLAKAYQRRGDSQRAQEALTILQKLNAVQADKIRSAPGDRKMGYRGQSQNDSHDHP
jgi:predicted Zn-dependent protease